MFKSTPAQRKIKDVFYAELREKPYRKIKVSDVVEKAQINRSTFYKNYEDVIHLYRALCDALTEQFFSLEPPQITDKHDLYVYCERLHRSVRAHMEEIRLLGGEHGSIHFLYERSDAYRRRMEAAAQKYGIAVSEELLQAYGSMMCVWLNNEIYGTLWQSYLYRDYSTGAVDLSKTLFENVASLLSMDYKGKPEFHYALVLSWVKLGGPSKQKKPTVTALLETAGISRTEFYLFYKNIEAFHAAYFDRLIFTSVHFGYCVCISLPERAADLVERFLQLNYQMVKSSVQSVADNGQMMLYFSALVYILTAQFTDTKQLYLTEKQRMTLMTLIGAKGMYCLNYYLGIINKQAMLLGLQRVHQMALEKAQSDGLPLIALPEETE